MRASVPTQLGGACRIPIHGWPGPPPEHATAPRYREMAGAGFTSAFSWFQSNDVQEKALDAAVEAGVRLFVLTPELASDPEATVKRFRDHPAVAGWHLQDEPNASDFPRLAAWARRIDAVDLPDAGHHAYVNLFPTYATPQQLGTATYQEHMDRFVDEVPIPILSFDHYPVLHDARGPRLRDDYYENFEIFTAAARRVDKPFWAFTLTTPHGEGYAAPTLANLRLQAFSDLAYGAQGIQHFTYWTPAPDSLLTFRGGPIERDGARTATYELVRQVNAEVQGLAPVFVAVQVRSVGHAGATIPRGTRRYHATRPVTALETGGPGVVVSLLDRGPQRCLAVVSRELERTASLAVRFDPSAGVERVGKQGGRVAVSGEYRGDLPPGEIVVFAWPR